MNRDRSITCIIFGIVAFLLGLLFFGGGISEATKGKEYGGPVFFSCSLLLLAMVLLIAGVGGLVHLGSWRTREYKGTDGDFIEVLEADNTISFYAYKDSTFFKCVPDPSAKARVSTWRYLQDRNK
jgi:hypothetical protein